MRHSHCGYCGTAFSADPGWPRTCPGCGEMTWHNPLPVAVALLPVRVADTAAAGSAKTGLVVVRRGIQPGYGKLGLPGGFMEVGESWQEAMVRELREETTIVVDPASVKLFDVHSTQTGHTLQVFGLLPVQDPADLPPMVPSDETLEWFVVTEPRDLVFNTHTRAMADYFASA
jgi:ADP-ribose pyrophosphatase YjhB (NUDIX family)